MAKRHSDNPFFLQFPADCFVRSTEKAKCFRFDDQDVWIPVSQILYEHTQDGVTQMTLPEWLVIEKGLESYMDEQWDDYGRPD